PLHANPPPDLPCRSLTTSTALPHQRDVSGAHPIVSRLRSRLDHVRGGVKSSPFHLIPLITAQCSSFVLSQPKSPIRRSPNYRLVIPSRKSTQHTLRAQYDALNFPTTTAFN
ncbi:hypothetical protein X975_26818, partial [Stegodyphus mimosarum]